MAKKVDSRGEVKLRSAESSYRGPDRKGRSRKKATTRYNDFGSTIYDILSSCSDAECCVIVCPHLFRYRVPVQVALTLVHALLVQEPALVRNEQGVAHKLPNCNINMPSLIKSIQHIHTRKQT